MPDIKVYSIAEHSFSFAGKSCDSGLGDNDVFEWDQDEATFTTKVGVDGEVTFSESKNNVHKVTLTLMQSSSYNQFLSGVYNGDITVPGGAGIAPLMIRDRQGLTMVAGQARITKPPPQKRSKEVGTISWIFILIPNARIDGGN